MIHLRTSILMTLMLSSGLAAAAWACKCPGPIALGLLADDGALPANARGLLWDYVPPAGSSQRTLPAIKLLGSNGQVMKLASEPVVLDGRKMALLRPADGFKPGQTYVFKGASAMSLNQKVTVTLSMTSLQKHPGSLELRLGHLKRQEVSIATHEGSCFRKISAGVLPVEIKLPQAAETFRSQLYYQTLVDNKLWHPLTSQCDLFLPGISWLGERGGDQLYTACDPGSKAGLSPGRHTVEMRALLPGTDLEYRSEKISVELSCPQ